MPRTGTATRKLLNPMVFPVQIQPFPLPSGHPFFCAANAMVAAANITAPDASAACDSYITAPLTASCGAGSCSNATGTPSCICPENWWGRGDFDFRSLPEQDGDCDKFYPFLRSLYFIGAIAAFLTIFPSFHIMKMAKPKSRKRTSGIMMFTMSIYSAAYFAFRGADPARSIGVDPMVTVLQAIYQSTFWCSGAHVYGTGKLTGWWMVPNTPIGVQSVEVGWLECCSAKKHA